MKVVEGQRDGSFCGWRRPLFCRCAREREPPVENQRQPSSVCTSGLFFNATGLSRLNRRFIVLPGDRAAELCKRWSLAGSAHAGLGMDPARTTNPPFMSSTRPGEGQYGREVEKWSTVSALCQEVLQMLSLLNFIPDTSNGNLFTTLMSSGACCLNKSCRGSCVNSPALLTSKQSRGQRVDTKGKTAETPDGTEDTPLQSVTPQSTHYTIAL